VQQPEDLSYSAAEACNLTVKIIVYRTTNRSHEGLNGVTLLRINQESLIMIVTYFVGGSRSRYTPKLRRT